MKRKLIYIYGLGYSGSTLLDWFLGTHPQMIGLGELYGLLEERTVNPDKATCACGKTMSHCSFWKHVAPSYAQLRSQGSYAARYSTLLKAYEGIIDPSVALVDSSKRIQALRKLLPLRDKIDLRIIHLVRDARGQASSTKRHRRRKGKFVNAPLALINWWLKMRTFESGLKDVDAPILRISYDDLCKDPNKILKHIISFADLDPTRTQVPLLESGSHTIFGNPMRKDPKRKTAIACDTRWKSDLSLNIWYTLLLPIRIDNNRWNKSS